MGDLSSRYCNGLTWPHHGAVMAKAIALRKIDQSQGGLRPHRLD
ncbi:hypothetical protein [Novosphingobium sp. TH158]|nr:hypothetical protein [Novosphingobium sp. TH158]